MQMLIFRLLIYDWNPLKDKHINRKACNTKREPENEKKLCKQLN